MEFKIKIGDKCKIPKTKLGTENYYSIVVNEAKNKKQDFLYYNGKDIGYYVLNNYFDLDDLNGDFFNLDEIELYEEEFPEKWCVKITEENKYVLEEERKTRAKNNYKTCLDNIGWLISDLNWDKTCISYTLNLPKLEKYKEITFDQFKKYVLKESETIKNLLETEFVIENCTLSQRLAIKAYCDEKEIECFDGGNLQNFVDTYPHIEYCITPDRDGYTGFTGTDELEKTKITFSELIQFLDQYQPEPEFKVGDIVVVESWHHDSIKLPQTCTFEGIIKNAPAPFKIKLNKDHWGKKNETWYFKKGEFRHATLEEIKKWKEENEIKLPKISDYNGLVTRSDREVFLNWGCTEISISTVKELLKLNLHSITLNGYMVDVDKVQQIKKFIEHNKL